MTSMAQPPGDSQNNPAREDIILGVDTHKDTHVASVITMIGVLIATAAFPTTTAGCRDLLGWARSLGASTARGCHRPVNGLTSHRGICS